MSRVTLSLLVKGLQIKLPYVASDLNKLSGIYLNKIAAQRKILTMQNMVNKMSWYI